MLHTKTDQYFRAEERSASDLGLLVSKPIDEAMLSFHKRLQACIKAGGRHFELAVSTDVTNINASFFFTEDTISIQ